MHPLENTDNADELDKVAQKVRLEIRSPAECTPRELQKFAELVNEGGEVDPDFLRQRIMKAEFLAFYYIGDSIVAVGALKRPNPRHRWTVFAKAESEDNPKNYPFEIGWLYTAKDARGKGIARKVAEGLVESAADNKIFVTTRSDNLPIHKLFEKSGFKQSGNAYPSERGEYSLVLYIRGDDATA